MTSCWLQLERRATSRCFGAVGCGLCVGAAASMDLGTAWRVAAYLQHCFRIFVDVFVTVN